jgi:Ca2+/Na+ antiporter
MEKKMKNENEKIMKSMKLFLLIFSVLLVNSGAGVFLIVHEHYFMGYFLILSAVFFCILRIRNERKEAEKIEREKWEKTKKEMVERARNGEGINV